MLLSDNGDTRRLFEKCDIKAKTVVNPIIDWKDADIWEYINSERVETNTLYNLGYFRVGCIGCPMAGKHRHKEFNDFPKIKNAYISAFDRMIEQRKLKGLESQWKNGNEVFSWWMEDENIEGQMQLSDFIEY